MNRQAAEKIGRGEYWDCSLIMVSRDEKKQHYAGLDWPVGSRIMPDGLASWKGCIIRLCKGGKTVSWWLGTGGLTELDGIAEMKYVPVEELPQ